MKHLFALALCAAFVGCSSTPAPRYHSLLSTSAPSAREAGVAPLFVDLAAVGVPAAVDQQEWVVRMPDDSLRLLELEQWVGPLRDELRAALFERLAQRYGAVDARTAPSDHAWRVKVDVTRFESIAGKEVWLDTTWSASATKRNTLVCHSSVREPVQGDAVAIAAAHRRAVVRLADEIGQRLQALTRGETPPCAPDRES